MNITAAGLPVKTVRHCADIGLVPASPRTESGYGTCDDGAVLKPEFVRRARGFPPSVVG